jgi:hypothetical protein
LIDSLRANISLPVLIDHDRLPCGVVPAFTPRGERARGKRSVVEVRRGVCSGCHLGLAIGNVNALKAGILRRCGNCGRYLYVVEEEENESPPAPTPAKPRRNAHDKSTATRSQVK